MSLTSHDSLLGWTHGFRINGNNAILGAYNITPPPYTPIIRSPTVKQVFNNWNFADTSLVLFAALFGSLIHYRTVRLKS